MKNAKIRIGYIPLVDAVKLFVAVDNGFAAAEGLDAELVREVSWSNVRDKLNIGLFDAAHLLAPVAIASSLGIGHIRVPLIAPFNLSLNGNAITVSPKLFAAMSHLAAGDIADPIVSSRALYRVVAERKQRGLEPLTFGMTFPFSNHNYQLRFWMAAGGIDPDEDVRLVVLPPPYMVESLASGHVDSFCVGGPWGSVAVESGVGRILHFGCELMARASEKVLAVRERWSADNPDLMVALIRALACASSHIDDPANHAAVAAVVARRLDVSLDVASRTLSGNLKIAHDGTVRSNDRYILIGRNGASRPDPVQAAWMYAHMVRWGQTSLSDELCATAKAVFRPELYDAVLGGAPSQGDNEPADGIGAFMGPDFDPSDVASYLRAWSIKRAGGPHLSVVR